MNPLWMFNCGPKWPILVLYGGCDWQRCSSDLCLVDQATTTSSVHVHTAFAASSRVFFFCCPGKIIVTPCETLESSKTFLNPPPPPLKLVLIVWSLTDLRGLDLPLEEIIPLFLTPSEFQCCVSKTNSCTNVKFPPGIKTPPGGGGWTRCLNVSGPPRSQPLSLFIVVAVSLNVFMLREPLLPEVFAKLLSENSNTDSRQ